MKNFYLFTAIAGGIIPYLFFFSRNDLEGIPVMQ